MEIHTEVKSELNKTLLRICVPVITEADYQIRMLQMNQIKGVLPVAIRGEGEMTVYEYEITGLVSMKNKYRQDKITKEEMEKFLSKMQETIWDVERYLLNSNRILLEPEMIFEKDGEFCFCYMPQYDGTIRESFHKLMECFVQWTDYQDIASVQTAFLLHKETMRENYSLTGIIESLGELEEKKRNIKVDKAITKVQTELWDTKEDDVYEESTHTYDTEEHDWITRQEMGSKIMKETDNLWNPVKKFLNRHKRPRWGDWDGIYIDEEEL